ncbi:MAG: acyltransferase family protein [Myxococcales bacterium]|nr:acyltransferase family protein [Myxococcales bacterium]
MVREAELDAIAELVEPFRQFLDPYCEGIEGIPRQGPALFVGNHTLGGVFDAPIMYLELWRQRRIYPRALGHYIHFMIPIWRDWLERYGVVEGTRANCSRLMKEGHHVLVFPGGGREVAKRRGEKYQLIWKERTGFARMAIEHRCPIVPFSAVGVEDALDIVFDANDFHASAVGEWLRSMGLSLPDELLIPIFKGIGITPIPRPERLYFRFAEPIDTNEYADRGDIESASRQLRDRVRAIVEEGIGHLQTIQEADPKRNRLEAAPD